MSRPMLAPFRADPSKVRVALRMDHGRYWARRVWVATVRPREDATVYNTYVVSDESPEVALEQALEAASYALSGIHVDGWPAPHPFGEAGVQARDAFAAAGACGRPW